MTKTNPGNYFEDFALGQKLRHAAPRTLGEGERALYTALYGSRFALQSSDAFARALGLPAAPLDDLLVFHTVFGKTVPDVSLNAIANLGYAAGVFGQPLYPGASLVAESEVIGLRENANRKTGVVYVRTRGRDQDGRSVVDYVRWVMVRKRDPEAPAPEPLVPELPEAVAAADLVVPEGLEPVGYDWDLAGGRTARGAAWEDYEPGERIDHVDGATVEESEHQLATRLYQNTAKVHFDVHAARAGPFDKRIVYGGHVISIARAASFNGLPNALRVAAINGGRHVAPIFAGDTVYAWSEVLERLELPGRSDLGALRLRTLGVKDSGCSGFPDRGEDGKYHPAVVLDFDYTVLIPRRG